MDAETCRKHSLKKAIRLGYPINKALPLLDKVTRVRTCNEIFDRLMCLHIAAACAYGAERTLFEKWLHDHGFLKYLTPTERLFITNKKGDPVQFQNQVEGMWALCWALGLIPNLDFSKDCADTFVKLFPDPRKGETAEPLRARIQMRPLNEIVAACDLAYCLHWGGREARLQNLTPPGKVHVSVIEERRRALEWLIGDEDWDEVIMDT